MRANKGVLIASLLGLVLGAAQPAVSAGSSPSTVTLASSANPSILGQAIKLTATVSPSGATGKVAFYDDANLLDTVPLADGQALISIIQLPSGHHLLNARYEGDATYAGAVSANLSQTILVRPSSGFMAPVTIPATEMPAGYVATGDFNGDGNLDIAGLSSDSVSVALGNGDGTFKPPVETSIASGCTGGAQLGVGDFNNDGKLDVVVTLSNWVCFLLGNGDGTFQAPIVVSRAGCQIYCSTPPAYSAASFVGGDFNVDGNADIAILTTDPLTDESFVQEIPGNGDGTFQGYSDPVNLGYFIGFNGLPASLASGDFNGDGIPDFAISNPNPDSVVPIPSFPDLDIYLGNGDGSFRSGAIYSGEGGVPVIVDDFNGDGKLDLAVLDLSGSSVRVFLGNGDGTFQNPVTYPVNPGTQSIASGDFNGDGIADLLAVSTNNPAGVNDGITSSYGVLVGNGDGTFQPEFEYSRPYAGIGNIVTGDFNHDGITDFALSTGGLQIVLGQPPLPFSFLSSPNPAPSGQDITLTAQVSPAPANAKIVFYDHDTVLGTVPLTGGSATLNVSTLAPGPHHLGAAYTDRSGTHTSPEVAQIVLFPSTTNTLTPSLNPAAAGQTVTFTATIAPAPETGTVWFWDHNTLLGSTALSGGTASVSTSTLALGQHRIVAIFQGPYANLGEEANSGLLVENIEAAGTTTLASSLNPVPAGQTVTFTATIAPAPETGTVSFYADNVLLGAVTLSGNTASLSTSTLSSGPHQITARYTAGGSTYNSQALTEDVLFPPTTATLTSSLNPAAPGQTVTFTATVAPASETGTVYFWDELSGTSTLLGSAKLSGGTASFSTSTLAVGAHQVVAVYRGPYPSLGEEANSNVLLENIE
jgi:hypothetical protein